MIGTIIVNLRNGGVVSNKNLIYMVLHHGKDLTNI